MLFRRRRPGYVATVIGLAVLIGCGGTGGNGSTTASTSGGGICPADQFVPNYNTSITQKRWATLPINVYFETSTAGGSTTLEDLCRDGFNEWESRLGRDLWQEVTNPGAANLRVRVETVTPQSTLGITTIFFFSGEITIQRAEMVIYSWPSLPVASYAGTATHEMGHAFGINGHSPNSTDIMFFTGNATDLLTTLDLNTVRTLYCDFSSSPLSAPTRKSQVMEKQVFTCPLEVNH